MTPVIYPLSCQFVIHVSFQFMLGSSVWPKKPSKARQRRINTSHIYLTLLEIIQHCLRHEWVNFFLTHASWATARSRCRLILSWHDFMTSTSLIQCSKKYIVKKIYMSSLLSEVTAKHKRLQLCFSLTLMRSFSTSSCTRSMDIRFSLWYKHSWDTYWQSDHG